MKTSFNHKGLFLLMPLLLVACSGADMSDGSSDDGGNGKSSGDYESYVVNDRNNSNDAAANPYSDRLEFPHLRSGSILIVHKTTGDSYDANGVNFCTEWDPTLDSQRWSCYQMHSGYGGSYSRYNPTDGSRQYPWDPDLSTSYYTATDYFSGSGFDHGHICPAADRSYSFLADKQTFYMTNMQPQYNAFNAGLWARLESQIRTWTNASDCDILYVCKGGTIDSEKYKLKLLGNHTIVPKYFYCALLLSNSKGYRAIAFWMTNENVNRQNDKLSGYAISVDELERRTGIDFFCNLPDDVEADRESRCDLSAWGL